MYPIYGMSLFVDNHYNRYSLLESGDQGSRARLLDAGRSSCHVGWLAVELLALKRAFVSQLADWLAVELLALKRAFVSQLAGWLAGWLAVELLALKRACVLQLAGFSFRPAEQWAVHEPSGRQRLAGDDDAGNL
jgi:hypothetical protein